MPNTLLLTIPCFVCWKLNPISIWRPTRKQCLLANCYMGTLCPTHMICFKHTLVFIGNFTPHINKFVEHLMLYTLYGFVYGWGFYRPFTKPKYIVFGSVISAILRALVAERDLTWCRRRCVCVCLRVCLDRLLCKIQNGVANTLDAPMR